MNAHVWGRRGLGGCDDPVSVPGGVEAPRYRPEGVNRSVARKSPSVIAAEFIRWAYASAAPTEAESDADGAGGSGNFTGNGWV